MPQSMSPLMFTTGYRWVHASTIVVRTINARTHRPTPYQYLWRWGSYFIPSGTIDGYDTRVMAMQKQAANSEVTTDLNRMNTFLKAEIVKGLTLNADFTYAIQNMNSGSQDNSVYGINWSGKPVPSYIVTKGNSGIWRDFFQTEHMDGQRIRKLYQNICQKTQPECNGRCQTQKKRNTNICMVTAM